MGAEIGIGALLAAAGISALGNLGGAAISASGANSANADMMAFNRKEAAKNRAFQKEMYQQQLSDQEMMYNKYQSPEAIARQLQSIGVNAAGVFGSGKSGFSGSLPSVPSVPSGSQASVGSLTNPMADYAQALKGSTSDAVSVLNAMTDKQLKDKQGLKILAEKANLQTQNEILQWQNMINQTVGSEKAKEELNQIIVQTATLATAGELNKAQTLVADTIRKLNQKEFDIKDEELWQLQTRGLFLVQSLKNEQDLQVEQIKTEKSTQANNYASASLSKALKNESGLRSAGLVFDNAIKKIDSENAAALATDKLYALKMEIEKSKALSREEKARATKEAEKLEYRIKHYKEYPGSVAFDEFFDNLPVIGGIMRGLK